MRNDAQDTLRFVSIAYQALLAVAQALQQLATERKILAPILSQ
jgi:hypothetical protein